jgi:hypothetical protein
VSGRIHPALYVPLVQSTSAMACALLIFVNVPVFVTDKLLAL